MMSITEREIFSQYESMGQTEEYFLQNKQKIKDFYGDKTEKNIVFVGCGSSYSVAKSAAIVCDMRLGVPVQAFAAGDLLLNFAFFAPLLRDSIVVCLSRSGNTSEVVLLATRAKAECGAVCVSVCAKTDTQLGALAGLSLELPWAFDESVCQTRTVSNLYLSACMLAGILSDDQALLQSLHDVIGRGETYQAKYRPQLEAMAKSLWNKVVVLADRELEGVAEEGSLAFMEIAMLSAHYYHILDVRHGPIVLIDAGTLVVAALTPEANQYEEDLLRDMKGKGATVVAFTSRPDVPTHSDLVIQVSPVQSYAAQGIAFLFVAQALALFKAVALGGNPDAPTGLNPWIKL